MSARSSRTRSAWSQLAKVPGRASRLSTILAITVPPAAAAAMVPLRSYVTNTALALVMVGVVVLVVTPGRRLAALAAGVSAGLWFDFFLTRPYGSFAISHSADVQTFGPAFGGSCRCGRAAARDRRHRIEGASTGDGLAAVQAVAELLNAGAGIDEVLDAVCASLVPLLHLESCHFNSSRAPVTIPYIERPGFVSYAVYRVDTEVEGLPVSPVTLPVHFDGQLVGRFVLQAPLPTLPVEVQRLHTAIVLADLAGLAAGRGKPRPLLRLPLAEVG